MHIIRKNKFLDSGSESGMTGELWNDEIATPAFAGVNFLAMTERERYKTKLGSAYAEPSFLKQKLP